MLHNKTKARIAFVVGECVPGGIKSVLFSYIEKLPKEQFSFDVVAYKVASSAEYSFVDRYGGTLIEIPSISHPMKYNSSLSDVLSKGNYDICHSMLNSLNPIVMHAAKNASIPVRIAENLSAGHPLEKKSKIKSLLKPFAKCWSTDIAANSNLAAGWLYGEDASDCEILPNPISFSKFEFDGALRKQMRESLDLDSRYVIGWIGRFAPQKNPLFLLEILRSVREKGIDAALLTVGYGPLEEEFLSLAQSMKLDSHLVHVGGKQDLTPYYCAMDCFVLPSLYEGLPVVGLEAQASGLPCVFSSEVTQEVSIIDSCSFVRLEAGPDAWAEAIVGARSQRKAADQAELDSSGFEQSQAVDKLVAYYESCLERASNE